MFSHCPEAISVHATKVHICPDLVLRRLLLLNPQDFDWFRHNGNLCPLFQWSPWLDSERKLLVASCPWSNEEHIDCLSNSKEFLFHMELKLLLYKVEHANTNKHCEKLQSRCSLFLYGSYSCFGEEQINTSIRAQVDNRGISPGWGITKAQQLRVGVSDESRNGYHGDTFHLFL